MFVDGGNAFYMARALGWDVDFGKLLRQFSKGRKLVDAFYYRASRTGVISGSTNEAKFEEALAFQGFTLRSKPVKVLPTGTYKGNLDVELTIDVMKLVDSVDVFVLLTGDGDFVPLVEYLHEQGKRVVIVSTKTFSATELVEVADEYYDVGYARTTLSYNGSTNSGAIR